MKKILACMSLVFALSASATALADDVTNAYTKDGNSLSVSLSGATEMNTILITKDGDTSDDGIVFVDQNDDGLGNAATGAVNFLLKGESLKPGKYNVKMNTKDGGEATTNTFTIAPAASSNYEVTGDAFTYHKTINGVDLYDTGFKAEAVNLANINYIAITNETEGPSKGKTAYIRLDSTVNGTVNVAIRVNNIPEGKSVSVKLVDAIPSSGN